MKHGGGNCISAEGIQRWPVTITAQQTGENRKETHGKPAIQGQGRLKLNSPFCSCKKKRYVVWLHCLATAKLLCTEATSRYIILCGVRRSAYWIEEFHGWISQCEHLQSVEG